MARNVLFITLDQFRGDCLSTAGHPVVRTPHLDALAAQGVRFASHYSQASPCAPGRASLYTGMYQMNHRVVANGTPLDHNFDNIARIATRAGYSPVLFGYTDQAIDPRVALGPDDARLSNYEGVLPGFISELDLTQRYQPWREFMAEHGHYTDEMDAMSTIDLLSTEDQRPADVSVSQFTTNKVMEWMGTQTAPWFAHVSYIRPHPPYAAAGHYSTMYDPADVGMPIPKGEHLHKFHQTMLTLPTCAAPDTEEGMRHMRAQYFGMVSEVDHQVGRLCQALRESGQWDNTVIVITADHAEMLGDHGLREKLGYWETSQHIVCIVRDPQQAHAHGSVVSEFTENVDIVPTLCNAMNVEIPVQVDGLPLTPFLEGRTPDWWRDAAHWEYDWRFALIPLVPAEWPTRRTLERQNLAVHRTKDVAYVQFADGDCLCFDLKADPTWRTHVTDPAVVADAARGMLAWRMMHANRNMTGFLTEHGGTGRWPEGVEWRENAPRVS